MDHATSASAGALIVNWLYSLSASISLNSIGALVGIIWVLVQIYYKIKNERMKARNGS